MVDCPTCKGEGKITPLRPGLAPIKCDICNGNGKVSEKQAEWHNRGQKMRKERLSAHLNIREMAGRLNCGVSELIAMERGKIEPSVSYR